MTPLPLQASQIYQENHKQALGFQSCRTASRTLCGIEAMHMIRKGQIKRAVIGDETRAQFINKLFGLAS